LADVTAVVLVPAWATGRPGHQSRHRWKSPTSYIINKADQPGAGPNSSARSSSCKSLSHRPDGWIPPIVRCVASEGQESAEAIEPCNSYLTARPKHHREAEKWSQRNEGNGAGKNSLTRAQTVDFHEPRPRSRSPKKSYTVVMSGSMPNLTSITSESPSLHRGKALSSTSTTRSPVSARETVEHEKVTSPCCPPEARASELLEPSEEDSVIVPILAKRAKACHHIAFRARPLAASVATLKQNGARIAHNRSAARAATSTSLYIPPPQRRFDRTHQQEQHI